MAGLYVHVPYCRSKCAYCDFYSTTALESNYLFAKAVTYECVLRADEVSQPFETIYFGGGTPSILPERSLVQIFCSLPVRNAREVTMEVNPDDVTEEAVDLWRNLGVNRVSMGVQSFCDEQLALIGRRHSMEQAVKAYCLLRDGGITNISIDLIYGLPTQTLESWRDTLACALDLRPEHLSAYILSYERGTPLEKMLKRGQVRQASDRLIVKMHNCLLEETRKHGYEHYEISNFALPGFRALHNSYYWDGTPYLGLGPGASSFDGYTRRYNPSDIRSYLKEILSDKTAYKIIKEDDNNRFNNMIMTALRTCDGLDMKRVPQERMDRLMRDAKKHFIFGELVLRDDRLIIPEEHWIISDTIFTSLMQI